MTLFLTCNLRFVSPLLVLALSSLTVEAEFLRPRTFVEFNATRFRVDIRDAARAVLRGDINPHREWRYRIRTSLLPLWQTMPHDDHGRVGPRALRYLVYRYFVRQFSITVRGFEPLQPSQHANDSAGDALGQHLPEIVMSSVGAQGGVQSGVNSQGRVQSGFTLSDVVYVIMMLHELVIGFDDAVLEHFYASLSGSVFSFLHERELVSVLESYVLHWLIDEEDPIIAKLLKYRTPVHQFVPQWQEITRFIKGQVKTLQFARAACRRGPQCGNLNISFYSLEEARDIVRGITTTFASFWRSECTKLREALEPLDVSGTGRVPLSKFYRAGKDLRLRFTESQEYLRELGALDESSNLIGPQVIIANYVVSASNCMVSMPYYSVCCPNECESMVAELEGVIRSSIANPSLILAALDNITELFRFDDDQPKFARRLVGQLEQIGERYNGQVPLHGRLFAQWLHFAFPRQCPFPHRSGTFVAISPASFGSNSRVSARLLLGQSSDLLDDFVPDALANLSTEEMEPKQWMAQWSDEEEFFVDMRFDNFGHASPQEIEVEKTVLLSLCLVFIVLWLLGRGFPSTPKKYDF